MKIRIQISKKENALAYNKQIGETIELPYRDYLCGVVASEIGNAHVEACKAQAIASRTFSYPYATSGKTISDSSQKAQSFRASRVNNNAYQNAYQAVDETDNQVLTYNGEIISPCSFSSSNGGKTTSSQSRWGGYRAWLIEQNDPWDLAATEGKKTGHGVGMSQAGAKHAAKAGFSYRDILSFYYPNTTIELMKGVDDSMSVKASYQVEKFKLMVEQKWKYVKDAASNGAVDCSGAFSYWYKQAGGYMYHGSNTMWRKYSVTKGKIGEIDLLPGMAVYKWRNDGKEPDQYKHDGIGNFYHVGQYIGNGKVIEAKGTHYGVVSSCISEWSHASRLKNTVYDISEEDSDDQSTSISFPVKGYVKTQGGRLRVRTSPVDGAILGQLANGTSLTIVGESNGWYRLNYKGTTGYVSGDYVNLSLWSVTVNAHSENEANSIVSLLKEKGYDATIREENT